MFILSHFCQLETFFDYYSNNFKLQNSIVTLQNPHEGNSSAPSSEKNKILAQVEILKNGSKQ